MRTLRQSIFTWFILRVERYVTAALPYYFAPRRSSLPPAVGLLVDLLPVDLLVGEVAA